ncbi:hypothetical protein KP509_31G006700 [Ceratopteris richardii]|nr:hypothetical protein KP509_31G006700 [Ceratopteris richardii]
MSKLALSCPRPAPSKPADHVLGLDAGLRGGHTELNMRKRQLREDLETVTEEPDQSSYPRSRRIMVYVRMRPMSKQEKEAGARSCVRVVNKQDVYLAEFASETDYLRLKRLKGRHFVFDAAFPDATGQQEVYNTSTAELLEGVLQGRNGCVFCYGATGAGKTHTMLGSTQNPGVMVLALRDLFVKLNKRCREGDYVVRLSYLEVYNESVRDLLSPGRPLILREDSKQGTIAAGLTHYEAYSADEIMTLLHQGNQNRTTEPTRANETSSRSHAILQVTVEYKVLHDSHYVCRTGKLSLIDLAGSERALATDQRTIRSLEGANINRSLLALSSCINALVEGKRHIPFRNSKLTQLLKDSLGGGCQTAMIANISPSNLAFGETQNTLHWADRAKQIRTKASDVSEEVPVPESESDQAKLLLEVQKENQQLRMQLARLQQKLLSTESSAIMVARHSPAPAVISTPVCRTPVSEAKVNRHEECREIEEALRKKISVLEKEKEDTCREMAEREDELAGFIASLRRDHCLQIRHKDEFTRKLCILKQQIEVDEEQSQGNDIVALSSTVQSCVEERRDVVSRTIRRAVTLAPRRMTIGGAVPVSGFSSALNKRGGSHQIPVSGSSSVVDKKLSSHQVGTKRSSLLSTPKSGAGTQRSRLQESKGEEENSRPPIQQRVQQHHQPPVNRRLSKIPAPPPTGPVTSVQAPKTPITASKGALRKRTFWDITNATSPSAPVGRCTRSNTSATPSMLLQPGFLGGRRRSLLQ